MESTGEGGRVTMSASKGTLDKTVIKAVAAATGKKRLELPPLYESVDLDALSALVLDCDCEAHVEFEHAGCSVTVDNGTVIVEPN